MQHNLQLKALRKRAGFNTQADLAQTLGMNPRTYASWEREEVKLTLGDAQRIADVLGCSLDELAGRAEPANRRSSASAEDARQRLAGAAGAAGRGSAGAASALSAEGLPRERSGAADRLATVDCAAGPGRMADAGCMADADRTAGTDCAAGASRAADGSYADGDQMEIVRLFNQLDEARRGFLLEAAQGLAAAAKLEPAVAVTTF